MLKKLGIIRHSYAQPLFKGLAVSLPDSPVRFELVQDAASRLVVKLLQDELDGAFLSPIEYAKYFSQLKIIPGCCLASFGESHLIELHFRDNLRNIGSLAINPEFSSEVVLAKMILAEKFDASPQLIALQNISPDALQKAESVLAVGDDCEQWVGHTNMLDLVDEWFDLTELPYIHGFWVTKEGLLSQEEIELLKNTVPNEEDFPLFDCSFTMDENTFSSLEEFYRMAFYYGILKDVPVIKMIDTFEL